MRSGRTMWGSWALLNTIDISRADGGDHHRGADRADEIGAAGIGPPQGGAAQPEQELEG